MRPFITDLCFRSPDEELDVCLAETEVWQARVLVWRRIPPFAAGRVEFCRIWASSSKPAYVKRNESFSVWLQLFNAVAFRGSFLDCPLFYCSDMLFVFDTTLSILYDGINKKLYFSIMIGKIAIDIYHSEIRDDRDGNGRRHNRERSRDHRKSHVVHRDRRSDRRRSTDRRFSEVRT